MTMTKLIKLVFQKLNSIRWYFKRYIFIRIG